MEFMTVVDLASEAESITATRGWTGWSLTGKGYVANICPHSMTTHRTIRGMCGYRIMSGLKPLSGLVVGARVHLLVGPPHGLSSRS